MTVCGIVDPFFLGDLRISYIIKSCLKVVCNEKEVGLCGKVANVRNRFQSSDHGDRGLFAFYCNFAVVFDFNPFRHRVGRVLSVSPVVGIGTPPPL